MILYRIFLFLIGISSSSSTSGFDCGHYGSWELIKNDTIIFDIVQQWISQWQSQCEKGIYHGLNLGNGIGSDLIGASNWFEFAIENNKGRILIIYHLH